MVQSVAQVAIGRFVADPGEMAIGVIDEVRETGFPRMRRLIGGDGANGLDLLLLGAVPVFVAVEGRDAVTAIGVDGTHEIPHLVIVVADSIAIGGLGKHTVVGGVGGFRGKTDLTDVIVFMIGQDIAIGIVLDTRRPQAAVNKGLGQQAIGIVGIALGADGGSH